MGSKEVLSTKIEPLSPYPGTGKGREQKVREGEKEWNPEEESEARHHLRTRVHRHRQANQRRRVFIHECIQNGKPHQISMDIYIFSDHCIFKDHESASVQIQRLTKVKSILIGQPDYGGQ